MTPTPGYADIAAHLRRLIQDGELAPGEQLPSMEAAKEQFGVAIATVNRAYQMLKTEGLTEVKPGRGTVVSTRPEIAVTGSARLKRMERGGQPYAPGESSSDHWRAMRSVADPYIAKFLDVEPHDEIVVRRRLHHRQGGPTTFDSSFIHIRALAEVPEILNDGPMERWWQQLYKERTGREVARSPERRTARIVSQSELDELGIDMPADRTAAVLVVVNIFHDEDGPLEVWEDVYPPGAWAIDPE